MASIFKFTWSKRNCLMFLIFWILYSRLFYRFPLRDKIDLPQNSNSQEPSNAPIDENEATKKLDVGSSSKSPEKKRCLKRPDAFTPVPVVVFSGGRVGSHATWQVLSNLTGQESRIREFRGASETETNDKWFVKPLCHLQKGLRSAGIVGIKWVTETGPELLKNSPGSMAALEYLRDYPFVKAIRVRRNVLDVTISQFKHKFARANKETHTRAHCQNGDTECINKHLSASTAMILPTQQLLSILRNLNEKENGFERVLTEMGVQYLHVSYEKLYSGTAAAADEWMSIFEYLGRGPSSNLTLEAIESRMSTVPTHHSSHNVTLRNYQEVRDLLQGTEFERLLH